MIRIGKTASNISIYTCQPKYKEELFDIVYDRVDKEGPNCDLNDIDTSMIADMSYLFEFSDFNGDISRWDTSNVMTMYGMFYRSKFNQDISNWKINKNCDIGSMFSACKIREDFKPKLPQQ